KSTCQLVTVFAQTNRFNEEHEQYSRSINVSIPYPTNSDIEIAKYAKKGLDVIFKTGLHYKKAGVIVGGITLENEKQFNLFEEEPFKHRKIMHTIDKLNFKYGAKKLKL